MWFMFVPSRGRGIIVAIVIFMSLFLTELITNRHFHDSDYYSQHGWPKLTAYWIAAAIVQWMLPGRQDEVLGCASQVEDKPSILRNQDSLLSIPVKYWPGVLFAIGIGAYFV
jgi:hypothetical protein